MVSSPILSYIFLFFLLLLQSPEYLDSLKPKEERRTAKNKYVFHEIYTDADEETDDIYWEDIPAGNHVSGAPKFDKESTAWYPGISNRNMLKNPPPELSE